MMNEKQLIDAAKKARNNAYVPYSSFSVGAAVLTEDGTTYTGSNIENASYSLTICAERVALFNAYAAGNKKIKALAVIGNTKEPISPCGACRQVMVELCLPNTVVILANMCGMIQKKTVSELLPGAFTAEELNEKRKRL